MLHFLVTVLVMILLHILSLFNMKQILALHCLLQQRSILQHQRLDLAEQVTILFLQVSLYLAQQLKRHTDKYVEMEQAYKTHRIMGFGAVCHPSVTGCASVPHTGCWVLWRWCPAAETPSWAWRSRPRATCAPAWPRSAGSSAACDRLSAARCRWEADGTSGSALKTRKNGDEKLCLCFCLSVNNCAVSCHDNKVRCIELCRNSRATRLNRNEIYMRSGLQGASGLASPARHAPSLLSPSNWAEVGHDKKLLLTPQFFNMCTISCSLVLKPDPQTLDVSSLAGSIISLKNASSLKCNESWDSLGPGGVHLLEPMLFKMGESSHATVTQPVFKCSPWIETQLMRLWCVPPHQSFSSRSLQHSAAVVLCCSFSRAILICSSLRAFSRSSSLVLCCSRLLYLNTQPVNT